MAYVYSYNLKVDTGLAPCVENGLLSLACCKGGRNSKSKGIYTGLRYWIGNKRDADYKSDEVYVVGFFKGRFLYAARISDAIEMNTYFANKSPYKGRNDDIYDVIHNKLVRNKRHRRCVNDNIHTGEKQFIRDVSGVYVLLSTDFIYLGDRSVSDADIKMIAPKNRETRNFHCKKGSFIYSSIVKCWEHTDGINHKPNQPLSGCEDSICR